MSLKKRDDGYVCSTVEFLSCIPIEAESKDIVISAPHMNSRRGCHLIDMASRSNMAYRPCFFGILASDQNVKPRVK
jgi:hypothetical protein